MPLILPTLPPATGLRTLGLGRLRLLCPVLPVIEAVGDQVEPDDSGVAVARRRPRMFTLKLPLYSTNQDSYTAGPRMRRQMRAMMENNPLRLAGLYFNWNVDTELNGWIVPGGGQITDQDLGGVTLGQWMLELDSALRIANIRNSREGRRVELYDRVLSTTPRDYRGIVLSTDFAGLRGTGTGPYLSTGQPTVLPVNVTDLVGAYRQPAVANIRAGIDGNSSFCVGLAHSNIVHFEQADTDMTKGEVVVWDRQGFIAPPLTLAGDLDPQNPTTGYGWEEVYGPDHPLTAADCVAAGNSLCRVRYVAATNSFAIDTYVAGTGYVEQGRVTVWESTATDVYTQHVTPLAANNGAYGTVLEWTPERTVIRVATTGAHCRIETVITLQRGWLGPRFEAYCNCFDGTTTTPGVQLRWTPNSTGNMLEVAPIGGQTFSGDDSLFGWAQSPGVTYAAAGEPWVYVQPVASSGTGVGVAICSIQSLARSPGYVDNAAYGGGNRQSTGVAARFNETQVNTGQNLYGYVTMHLAFDVPGSTAVMAASAIINPGGTRSLVASDTGAVNANVVTDTQATAAATTIQTAALPAATLPFGQYLVAVRVRAGAAGTVSARGNFAASATPVVTTTSATYVWLVLGEAVHASAADTFSVTLWSTGGDARIDRAVLVPVERRTVGNVTHDGARDVAGVALYDNQPVPTYIER